MHWLPIDTHLSYCVSTRKGLGGGGRGLQVHDYLQN